ncbi:transketolase, partial [Streptococcus danieliae]|nr:transketolase [Streptococcus danieliae]
DTDKSFNPEHRSTASWSASPYGRVLHFGIREHAAAAITNGIVLASPPRPFNGTFFVLTDYQRAAVRLAAVMGIPNIFVWTHDSI